MGISIFKGQTLGTGEALRTEELEPIVNSDETKKALQKLFFSIVLSWYRKVQSLIV